MFNALERATLISTFVFSKIEEKPDWDVSMPSHGQHSLLLGYTNVQTFNLEGVNALKRATLISTGETVKENPEVCQCPSMATLIST